MKRLIAALEASDIDQAGTMIPVGAADAGADRIVVGRPVTASADPAKVASIIAAEIA
jgi:orotidine-5'-phosphate decarboxylase